MAGSKKKAPVQYLDQTEALKETFTGIKKSLVRDLGIAGFEETYAQVAALQGQDHHKSLSTNKAEAPKEEQKEAPKTIFGGDLAPGEWLDLIGITSPVKASETAKQAKKAPHEEQPKEQKKNAAPGIDYHREVATSSDRALTRQHTEVEQRIGEVMNELKRIVESSNKIIQDEFGKVTVEQTPTEVGKYHVNFLDWMLITLQTARQKVEDSGAWLSTMKSKKDKKGYWGMFKKHGTSFGMSNERQVATQTG